MFHDRREAGKLLVPKVTALNLERPIIIAIPRGGIVVAADLATELDSPLFVVLTRKLGAPMNPEYAIGAVAPDGTVELNDYVVQELDIAEVTLKSMIEATRHDIQNRSQIYGTYAILPDLRDRNIILVDDGIATGYTTRVAITYLRSKYPKSITLAVPVLPKDRVDAFSLYADNLVYLKAPEFFAAVGQFYRDFPQVTHEEVLSLLRTLNSPTE
ncbi:MAG TPA: phosphoribosyltransferase family protein [Clostridiaceae bacterium]|nr:phosphoribosyltransferase family protein [Clostridiaceae bacterium]